MAEIFIPPSPSSFDKKPEPTPPTLPAIPMVYTPAVFVPCTFLISPCVSPAPFALHEYLCWDRATGSPKLNWDLIHSPQFSTVYHPEAWIKPNKTPDLKLDAFAPAVDKAWIISHHPILMPWMLRWGPIALEKKNISIGDILQAIYDYLRVPLTADDITYLSTIPGNRENLRRVRALRAREAYDLDIVVLKSGYRRVDVLGTCRRFKSLSILTMADNTWRLDLDLLPGSARRYD